MPLSLRVENAIGDFANSSGFTERGGVVIDLDGTLCMKRTDLPRFRALSN
jgi:hypothetical protein